MHKPDYELFFHPDRHNADGYGDDVDSNADQYANRDADIYAHCVPNIHTTPPYLDKPWA
jgi:hypothetical protein